MRAWLAQRQDDRRVWRWLWISIALHLPLTPLGPLFGLVALLTRCSEPPTPVEQLKGIPVELLEEAPAPQAPQAVEDTIPADEFPAAVTERPKKRKHLEHDDDALDAGVELPLAATDASTAVAKLEDAGADAAVAVASAPSAEEGLAAATHGIANSNANVQLSIYMNRVRKHPLSTDVAQLLKSLYQWREFFASGGLDPVKDFDQIMLFGPEFRDSSQVAAFLQHNVRAPRMNHAVDVLVKQSGANGEWLKDTKYPTAHARADRAQRSFILYPSQVVAVLPPQVEKDALALPNFKLPKPNGDELVRAFVKYPAGPLGAFGVQISKSIRSATLKIFGEPDGGARIEAVLEDANPEAAQTDAKQMLRNIDFITKIASKFLNTPVDVHSSVADNKITLGVKVTRDQAELIFTIAMSSFTPAGKASLKDALKSPVSEAAPSSAPSSPKGATQSNGTPDKPESPPPNPATTPQPPEPAATPPTPDPAPTPASSAP